MNALIILLVAIAVLVCGYVFYGGWLAKQWGIDPNRPTPAHEFEDGKDYVHINWRDGVNVIDGKKGDHVHVGWDGVHINDREFDNLADANAYMGTGKRGPSFLRAWNRFPFPLVVLVAYILVGLVYDAWGYGLFLIAAIPVYYALGGLFGAKRIAGFFCTLYVVGAICWFCYMAFVCNQPHPAWVVFLTIPLVGWLTGALSHWWRKRRK